MFLVVPQIFMYKEVQYKKCFLKDIFYYELFLLIIKTLKYTTFKEIMRD